MILGCLACQRPARAADRVRQRLWGLGGGPYARDARGADEDLRVARPPAEGARAHRLALRPGLEGLFEDKDFRRYQSGQPTIFSGAYIITLLQYVYTWLILQFYGRLGPTGTFGNSVPPTKRRA